MGTSPAGRARRHAASMTATMSSAMRAPCRGMASIVQQRREGIRRIVHSLADRGLLRPGLDPDRAADIVFGLQRPETFTAFVHECGWTVGAYKAWSFQLLCDQLLDPPDGQLPAKASAFEEALAV